MWLRIAVGAAVLGTLFVAPAAGSRTDTGDAYTRCCFLVVAQGEGTITEYWQATTLDDGTAAGFDGGIVHTFKWTSRGIYEYNEENDKTKTPYMSTKHDVFKTTWWEQVHGPACKWQRPDANKAQECKPVTCDETWSTQDHWSRGDGADNMWLNRVTGGQVKMGVSGGVGGGNLHVQGSCGSGFGERAFLFTGFALNDSKGFPPPSRATFHNDTSFSVSHPETDAFTLFYTLFPSGKLQANGTFSANFTYFKHSKLKKQLKALAKLN